MKAKFMFSLICVAAVTLTACEEYPYQQQKAASLRPSGIDVGNVNSSIVGTINPANLGQ